MQIMVCCRPSQHPPHSLVGLPASGQAAGPGDPGEKEEEGEQDWRNAFRCCFHG